jgi:integrase
MAKGLDEIMTLEEILDTTTNIKHKAILMLMYSGGLRVGEVVTLKPEDIDSQRSLIHIKESKGRRDRYTILSKSAMVILKKYYIQYKPKRWLFEGVKPGKHISTKGLFRRFQANM